MGKKIDIAELKPVVGTLYPPPFDEACRRRERTRLGDAAGLTQYGTIGAGEFVSKPEYFSEAVGRLPKAWPKKNLQIDPQTGAPHTAHTTNPVPFVAFGTRAQALRGGGSLRDVAPTVLSLLGLESPAEMTGRALMEMQ